MVSPTNTSPALTSDLAGNASAHYHPGYFRTASNDLYQGQAVAQFAYRELGLRRMVSIEDGDPYSAGLAAAFGEAFRALGGEVAFIGSIEKGDTDMTEVLAQFAAAAPEGIFIPLFESEGSALARQVRAFDGLQDAILIADAALLVPEFLATAQSEGIYFAGPEAAHGGSVNGATGKSADEILAVFASTYGDSHPSPYWAHGYDATTLLLSARNSQRPPVFGASPGYSRATSSATAAPGASTSTCTRIRPSRTPLNCRRYTTSRRETTRARNSPVVVHSS